MPRYLKVYDGKQQSMPQELPVELEGATDEEAADEGWYRVVEVNEEDLPVPTDRTERILESNYIINEETKTVDPIYIIEKIYKFEGTIFEGTDPNMAIDFIEAEDKHDNIYLSSLGRGVLHTPDTI